MLIILQIVLDETLLMGKREWFNYLLARVVIISFDFSIKSNEVKKDSEF